MSTKYMMAIYACAPNCHLSDSVMLIEHENTTRVSGFTICKGMYIVVSAYAVPDAMLYESFSHTVTVLLVYQFNSI